MHRRQSLKLLAGAAVVGSVDATQLAAASKSPNRVDTTVYLGMCVGHYKHQGLSRAKRAERLAKKGFR